MKKQKEKEQDKDGNKRTVNNCELTSVVTNELNGCFVPCRDKQTNRQIVYIIQLGR